MSGKGDSSSAGSYMKVEKRRSPRKAVPVSNNTPMVMGELGGSFNPARRSSRKKPSGKINACLISERETNCHINDLSETGLCIFHTADLVEGQTVGIFLRILWGIEKQVKGFTLICKVARHWEWEGPEKTCHLTGLDIVSNSNSIEYNKFVASLPPADEAHA